MNAPSLSSEYGRSREAQQKNASTELESLGWYALQRGRRGELTDLQLQTVIYANCLLRHVFDPERSQT